VLEQNARGKSWSFGWIALGLAEDVAGVKVRPG